MKRIALLLVPLAFNQCSWMSPMRGQRDLPVADPGQTENRWEGRELERAVFADGLTDGAADHDSGSPKAYSGHPGRFGPGTEQAYREGYNEGYDKSAASDHKATERTAAQQQVYDAGYSAGVRDHRLGRGDDPDQYAGTYDAKFSSWFLDGYHDGLEGR